MDDSPVIGLDHVLQRECGWGKNREFSRPGLFAGGETAATSGDPASTRLEARSLMICSDFLRQRLSVRFSIEDDRDLGEEAAGEDGRRGDAP
jgi:hypothetical protein